MTPLQFSLYEKNNNFITNPKFINKIKSSLINDDLFKQNYYNFSENKLNSVAKELFAQLKSIKIVCETQLAYWSISFNHASKKEMVHFKTDIKRWEMGEGGKRVVFISENMPLTYKIQVSSDFMVKELKESISSCVNDKDVDLNSTEWCYNISNTGLNDQEIQCIVDEFKNFNFGVSFGEPHVAIVKMCGQNVLITRQYLKIKFPMNADLFINSDQMNSSNFSQSNLLLKRKNLPRSDLAIKQQYISVGEALNRLNEDLSFLINENSMVRKFAFSIENLNEEDQSQFLHAVRELGFRAEMTAVYIVRQYSGGGFQSYISDVIKRDLLIDLPNSDGKYPKSQFETLMESLNL